MAEDDGRWDDAGRFFDDAVRLDPGFSAAQQRSNDTRAISAGTAVTSSTIQTSLQGTTEGSIVAAASGGSVAPTGGSLGGTLAMTTDGVNASTAQGATAGATSTTATPLAPVVDAVSAATGADKPTTTGVITITLPRPKLP